MKFSSLAVSMMAIGVRASSDQSDTAVVFSSSDNPDEMVSNLICLFSIMATFFNMIETLIFFSK